MNSVQIEKLVFGGYGLARDAGGVVLIPQTAPGETVEYADDGSKGGTRVGRVTRIIEKSPHRREPPCPHYGECGGCDWMYLTYDEQVRCKREIFLDCVDRIGKFERPDDIDVLTAENPYQPVSTDCRGDRPRSPAPAEFAYRIRAQIKIDHQNKRAGFYKRKTNDVVKINKCPLLVDEINDVLMRLNSGMINTIPKGVKAIKTLVGVDTASSPVIGGLTRGDTEIIVDNKRFLAAGGSFFQSNKFLLEPLGRWARGHIGGGCCLDLYGGIGFFSLMLADDFDEIILVENVAAQVRGAERNFRRNDKNHLKAILADVEHEDWFSGGKLRQSAARGDKPRQSAIRRGELRSPAPDCVIIDPPRPGLVKNVRKWLTDTAPQTILYVSCNPSTFARDAAALVAGGYKLSRWALFDLYPNTHHIESAAIFRR